ncbi:MAG: SRPBCC family protein, partial [Chloroflexota bacterium]
MSQPVSQAESKEKPLGRHYEESITLNAAPEDVFALVDDHSRLSSHMSQSSWLMGGGRMEITLDQGQGREVGSHIRLSGEVLGMRLFLDEVVTRREPPGVKVWQTVGDVRLLVIGHYRMAIEVKPQPAGSLLRVAIDYDLPSTGAWLGRLCGGFYARWCVQQMIKGAREAFRPGHRDRAVNG